MCIEYSNTVQTNLHNKLICTERSHLHHFCQWRRLPDCNCNFALLTIFCCWILLHSSSAFILLPSQCLLVEPSTAEWGLNQPLRSEWHKVCGVGSYSGSQALAQFSSMEEWVRVVHNLLCPWSKMAKIVELKEDTMCVVQATTWDVHCLVCVTAISH